MADFEVIVAGLGAYGSAALHQLADRGAGVVGLDHLTPPHDQGSSHGESRITRLAIGEGAHLTPIARRSHQIWRQIEAQSGRDLLTQCGGLWLSSPNAQACVHVADFFATTLAAAKAHGVPHELLAAPEIRRRFPQFAVGDDARGYFEPEAGFLRPEACIAAQLDLAVRKGAIVRHAAVLGWRDEGRQIRVQTDGGDYTAKQLILSCGAWLPGLLGPKLAHLFRVTRQVLAWFRIAGDAAAFAPGAMPVFIWQPPHGTRNLYGFPSLDGRGVKVASEQDALTTTPGAVERSVSAEELAELAALVSLHLPGLAPEVVRTAVCLYTVTPDAGFIVDCHPDTPRVLIVSACSGHGFKHSAALGEAVAEWGTTGRLPALCAAFALARISR